jgi:hypothetical protein
MILCCPSMVTSLLVIAGSEVRIVICPYTLKSIVCGPAPAAFTFRMACRKEPGPASNVLVTGKEVAAAPLPISRPTINGNRNLADGHMVFTRKEGLFVLIAQYCKEIHPIYLLSLTKRQHIDLVNMLLPVMRIGQRINLNRAKGIRNNDQLLWVKRR